MRRTISALIAASLLLLALAAPAAAAKPERFVIDIGDPEFLAALADNVSADCGFPIAVTGSGHIIVHIFDREHGVVEIDNYRMFETFSANGKTVVVRPDAGPDIFWIGRDGHLYLAITGRPITGSGVIGRTVFDLTAGDFVSSHGKVVGEFIPMLCAALAP